MKKVIKLLDYKKDPIEVKVEMDGVQSILLEVVTGDELIEITRVDSLREVLDPSWDDRLQDYYDYSYLIYDTNPENPVNLLDDEEWIGRKSSYDWEERAFSNRRSS